MELGMWVKSEKRFLLFISLFCFSCILLKEYFFVKRATSSAYSRHELEARASREGVRF